MSIVLPVASGKGGVGKSLVAANLSYELASLGKTVVLVDLDWGGSNAHTLLGVMNNNEGIGRYMLDKERTLAEFVVPVSAGLSFIPGDGQVSGGAMFSLPRKQKLLKELAALEADYVVLDLGAGSHSSTVDAFLSSGVSLIVTTPEPTALLNAYSFLKTCLFRLLHRAVPAQSEARALVHAYFTSKENNGRAGLDQLTERVRATDPVVGEKLAAARARLQPRVVLNMGVDDSEKQLGAKLRQVCERQLGLGIEYVGLVPWDPTVRQSVVERQLICRHRPEAPFARAVSALARRTVEKGFAAPPWASYDDLDALGEF